MSTQPARWHDNLSPVEAVFKAVAGMRKISTDPDDLGEMDEADAECDVAAQMVKADEVAELVADLRAAVPFLRWAADQGVPGQHLEAFRTLDRRARGMQTAVEELLEKQRDAA